MRRRPLEHRVQSSRSSSSIQHRFDPKLRGMGGVTERSQLKKYEKNRKCKIRNQYNKDLKKFMIDVSQRWSNNQYH